MNMHAHMRKHLLQLRAVGLAAIMDEQIEICSKVYVPNIHINIHTK